MEPGKEESKDQLKEETQKKEVVSPCEADGDIERIAKDVYGLSVTSCRQLNGYRDKNCHILVSPCTCNPHLKIASQEGYVVKIINTIDTNQPEILHVQVELMRHLHSRNIPVQEAVPAIDGDFIKFHRFRSPHDSGETRMHAVCLRTYIPGDVLYDITLTPDLCYDLGVFLGDITIALEDFHHPFYDTFDVLWSLDYVPKLKDIVHVITDLADRRIIDDVIQEYSDAVLSKRQELRTGLIHGDASEQNIVLRPKGTNCQSNAVIKNGNRCYEIAGILDYEHAANTHSLYDLAIMIAYVSLKAVIFDPLDVGGHILARYTSRVDLPELERSLLRVAMAARLAQSLVIGAHSHTLDPTNQYILATSKPGWKVIRALWATPTEALYRRWDEIENSYRA